MDKNVTPPLLPVVIQKKKKASEPCVFSGSRYQSWLLGRWLWESETLGMEVHAGANMALKHSLQTLGGYVRAAVAVEDPSSSYHSVGPGLTL